MDDSEEHDSSKDVKSLIEQLNQGVKISKNVNAPAFSLAKEELEQFVLDNTGRLIKDSMETIDSIKQYIINAPEPEDVHSLAELYKASTSAIEALNKILLQQQKSQTQITVKTMDIQAKKALIEEKENRNTFTREEIMDQLMNSGKIIDADVSGPGEEAL